MRRETQVPQYLPRIVKRIKVQLVEEESSRLGGFLSCLKMGACLAVDEAAVRSRALDKENK